MSIKKIIAFTGIRSDYDLLSGLYKKLTTDPEIKFGLIVEGAHLSPTYGYTIRYIEEDGLPIHSRIETLIDSDSRSSRIKSASILLQCSLHTVEEFGPDLIIYSGDREDALVGALIGSYLGIPTIHFFGGDHATDGNVDNSVRHAISKLSSIHFVSHQSHVDRLLKIGEPKSRIFCIGSPALDKFIEEPLINKRELLERVGKSEWEDYAIVIFHPILGDEEGSIITFSKILSTLRRMNINAFVSYPNIDAGNKEMIKIIENLKQDNSEKCFYFYSTLPRFLFVNLMRHALFLIGNSSTGIIEAPIIPLAAINVGRRQMGRFSADNVVFVGEESDQIVEAINIVLSEEFRLKLKNIDSPYGDGKSAVRAFNLIKSLDLSLYKYKKEDPLYEQ